MHQIIRVVLTPALVLPAAAPRVRILQVAHLRGHLEEILQEVPLRFHLEVNPPVVNPSGNSGGASNPSGPPPSPPGQPSNPPSNPNSGGCDHPLRASCLVYKPLTKECRSNGEVLDINAKCPTPVTAPPGHTKDFDFGQGFTQGAEDGKVGVYDAAAACAGASNTGHCIQGYDDE